ncbi:MAG: GxxExxY protein [Anaerolineales bacterium]|nr:GxxExxY protein [Anaerolineales bacterium]MCB0015836.1 GxxExxY protein [Anaerolineales bacterium]
MTLKHQELAHTVIGAAMEVHSSLRQGYLESVYENAMVHELTSRGLEVATQVPLSVRYKGVEVGRFVIDMLINDLLIVELKAIQRLTDAHVAQALNYLTATEREIALLLNFGARSLQFKRVIR